MGRKGQLIAISTAALVSAGALTVTPFVHANMVDTREQLLQRCDRAKILNGKRQTADIHNGYMATTCDLVDQKFTEFDGAPLQISRRFRNCPPDLFTGGKASAKITAALEQGGGYSTWTELGINAGLLGVLNGHWRDYRGTRDLTTKTISVRFDAEANVPQNRIVTFKFVPRMVRMTANWHVILDGNDGYPGGIQKPDRINEKVAEEVTGPLLLPSGIPDGTMTLDTSEPCPEP